MNTPRKVYAFDYDKLIIEDYHQPGDVFFLWIDSRRFMFLTLSEDRRLYDEDGNEFACEDARLMTDREERAGVGVLSLPTSDPLTEPAKYHDFKYSCRVYELNHPRSEADKDLERDADALSPSLVRRAINKIAYGLVRLFGGRYWDINETRDK